MVPDFAVLKTNEQNLKQTIKNEQKTIHIRIQTSSPFFKQKASDSNIQMHTSQAERCTKQ